MLSNRMKNLVPYVPGEQPRDRSYIKLNTNENPYPPSPEIDEFLYKLDIERLRLYPDPLFSELRTVIAEQHKIESEQVFIGNGSDEVLAFAFYAFFDSLRGPLLFPEFSYSFYPVYCDLLDIEYQKIPLTDGFSIDITPYHKSGPTCGMILPNPNAPTGILLPIKKVVALLNNFPKDRVIILDEAYIDFGGESAVSLIHTYKNLLIVRTFSKSYSLAGIRTGYAMGDKALIDALFVVKDSFNSYPVSALSQEIARIAVTDKTYFDSVIHKIIDTREFFTKKLSAMGWNVLPSSANFVFAEKKGIPGETIYQTLKERGILVRYFNKPGIDNFVRITIGTKDEMNTLLKEIKKSF